MDAAEKQKQFDEHQEDICSLCEDKIIRGNSMTSTFLCEGRFCDDALQRFIAGQQETDAAVDWMTTNERK